MALIRSLDRSTTPHDAGLGRVVKLDKATADGEPIDFVGRAALEARDTATPTKVLVGLEGAFAEPEGFPAGGRKTPRAMLEGARQKAYKSTSARAHCGVLQ